MLDPPLLDWILQVHCGRCRSGFCSLLNAVAFDFRQEFARRVEMTGSYENTTSLKNSGFFLILHPHCSPRVSMAPSRRGSFVVVFFSPSFDPLGGRFFCCGLFVVSRSQRVVFGIAHLLFFSRLNFCSLFDAALLQLPVARLPFFM